VLEYFSNALILTKIVIAIFCFPIIMICLGSVFFLAVSSVFSTAYFCYAMEKDVGEISKPEICHALLAIPPSLPENGAKLGHLRCTAILQRRHQMEIGDASMEAD